MSSNFIARVRIADVVEAACEMGGLYVHELVGLNRVYRISHWRKRAMAAAYAICGQSLPVVGRHFGGRDHTTVLWAVKAHRTSEPFAFEVLAIAERAVEIAEARGFMRVSA